MTTVLDLIENFKELGNNLEYVAEIVTERNSDHVLSKVRNQLWDGQKPDGSDITPSYLDDPYFKTRKQAEAYANWKLRITPNSKRNKYAPNYYINGYAYKNLILKTIKDRFEIDLPWEGIGTKIHDAMGLSLENANEIIDKYVMSEWIKLLEAHTGLKFN